MKLCVFINGTNCAGKSSVAKELISRYGGISQVGKTLTECCDSRVCFAGRYVLTKRYGGVDGLNSTRVLADVVRDGLSNHDIIICEGSYFHTVGLNLTNAMFQAERHLVVFLYAPINTLNDRLLNRGGEDDYKRDSEQAEAMLRGRTQVAADGRSSPLVRHEQGGRGRHSDKRNQQD